MQNIEMREEKNNCTKDLKIYSDFAKCYFCLSEINGSKSILEDFEFEYYNKLFDKLPINICFNCLKYLREVKFNLVKFIPVEEKPVTQRYTVRRYIKFGLIGLNPDKRQIIQNLLLFSGSNLRLSGFTHSYTVSIGLDVSSLTTNNFIAMIHDISPKPRHEPLLDMFLSGTHIYLLLVEKDELKESIKYLRSFYNHYIKYRAEVFLFLPIIIGFNFNDYDEKTRQEVIELKSLLEIEHFIILDSLGTIIDKSFEQNMQDIESLISIAGQVFLEMNTNR